MLELRTFFLNQLNILFPKINIYYQRVPQTIKCQLAITEYGASKFNCCNNNCFYNSSYKSQHYMYIYIYTHLTIFSDIYNMETVDETDHLYKNQKNLNLTLQYNEV